MTTIRANASKSVPAETVHSELMRIHERDGIIMSKTVVDEARPKIAPLHPGFEWRDKVAGEKHRIWQAQNLVRSVRVEYEDNEPVQVFAHVVKVSDDPMSPSTRGYMKIDAILEDDLLKESAISELARQLEGHIGSLDALCQQLGPSARSSGTIRRAGSKLREAKSLIGSVVDED